MSDLPSADSVDRTGLHVSSQSREDSELERRYESRPNRGGKDENVPKESRKRARKDSEIPITTEINEVSNAPPSDKVGKTRAQMLEFLDSLVKNFNDRDVTSLATSVAHACAESVILRARLHPQDQDRSTSHGGLVGTNGSDDTSDSYCSHIEMCGISSVLLVWTLLHEYHPRGVMKIIDKRICYRQVIKSSNHAPNRNAAENKTQQSGTDDDQSSKSTGPSSMTVSPENSTSADALPNSIVEMVVKFTGSFLGTCSLHEALESLTKSEDVPTLSVAQLGSESEPDCIKAFIAKLSSCITAHLANQNISAVAAVSCSSPDSGEGPVAPACKTGSHGSYGTNGVKDQQIKSTNGNFADPRVGVVPSDSFAVTWPGTIPGPLKYLLEMRLVFDPIDRVTEWAISVLAVERS